MSDTRPSKRAKVANRRPLTALVVALGGGVLAVAAIVWVWRQQPRTDQLFEDVTMFSGIAYRGVTYGAAWGDFDGDGRPDLFLTNHLNEAKLFKNLGGGRFADVTSRYFRPEDLAGDKHGAAWADVDNDGRQDLVLLTGAGHGVGAEGKHLFLNRGTHFEDKGSALGVANPFARARMPLWVDLDNDGRLDLFQGAERRLDGAMRPPFFFLQKDHGFVAADRLLEFASPTVPFCVLTVLGQQPRPHLVCRVSASGVTAQLVDLGHRPPRLSSPLPRTAFEDIAAGDFDNDGSIDLFLARRNPPAAIAFGRRAADDVIADILIRREDARQRLGFRFRSKGQVELVATPVWPLHWLTEADVYLGGNVLRPGRLALTLSPETAHASGLAPDGAGRGPGLYVGRIGRDGWEVRVSASPKLFEQRVSTYQQLALTLRSSQPITDLEPIGATVAREEAPARLFVARGGGWVEEGHERGVNRQPIAGVNVVAGDFDNDMHLDLFVVGSGEIGKQKNLLLLNRGDGHFDVVGDAGGAAGSSYGVGDSVTTADFDGDGFLDLLIATGGSMGRSEGPPSQEGGYYLYRNRGNGNHWLEIDLEGISSNRDGIGARVTVTAGGVTQTRIQDGGVHYRGQNFRRIHFGLGTHRRVDRLVVYWPSGIVQVLRDLETNRVLRVREPEVDDSSRRSGSAS